MAKISKALITKKAKTGSVRQELESLRAKTGLELADYVSAQKKFLLEARFGRMAQKASPSHLVRRAPRNNARGFTLCAAGKPEKGAINSHE